MKKTLAVFVFSFVSIVSQAQKRKAHVSYMAIGKAIYAKHCQTCHQVDGSGAQNMIPPLIKTEYVLGPKEALIKILLNGLNGELKVDRVTYGNEMSSQAILTDREIAAVLTYVRKSFGNKASLVHVAEVKKVRAFNKNTTPAPKS